MGGGGGAIDTESQQRKDRKGKEREQRRQTEKRKKPISHQKTYRRQLKGAPNPKQHNTDTLKKNNTVM